MELDIKPTDQGLRVKASMRPEQAKKMLDELAKCANGTCPCKSADYERLDSMQVSQTDVGWTLDLTAKSGQDLNPSLVAECLNHTSAQMEK